MSEFRENWPQSTNIEDHTAYIQEGLNVINNTLLLPEDGRWNVAYGALTMGGRDGAVFAEGQPGSGKTAFGNIVFGEDIRVDIASTDTAETLEGYESPVDHRFVAPKMHLNSNDMRLFFNELSHLRDTGPLHKYWDGDELVINGVRYDLANVSIYSAANFADGNRSKKIDPALRSRQAVSVLAGDNGKEIAARLHGMESTGKLPDSIRDGLLPDAKNRGRLRDAMTKMAPRDKAAGQYITNVLVSMTESGLLLPVDLTDKRTSNGWAQAARAHRLVTPKEKLSGPIDQEDLARVASLTLGSIASLSSGAMREFSTALGTSELTKLQKAVLARRVVAGIAMNEVIKMRDMSNVRVNKDEELAHFMDKRSYASLGENAKANQVIVDSLLRSKVTTGDGDVQPQSKRRFSLRSR